MVYFTKPCAACKASMIWSKAPSGANLPIDAKPLVQGDERITERVIFYTLDEADPPNALVVNKTIVPGLLAGEHEPLYLSHYATCPEAQRFSNKARKR